MRICIPITNLTFEGNVVFYLAKELAKAGHTVTIIAPHGKELLLHEKKEGVLIKRFRYFFPSRLENLAYGSGIANNISENPLKLLLLPMFILSFALKIFSESRKSDIIHANWLPSALACLPAHLLLKKPVVLTVHGTDVRKKPKWIIKLGVKASNAITTSHEGLLEDIERGQGKATIIRNMIDFEALEKTIGLEELKKEFDFWKKPVILFIGRFVEVRDPHTFVKAAKLLPNANFVMVGGGNLLKETKKIVQNSKAKNVFFVGRRNDVAKFLKLSSAFVSTATFDNVFSSTTVEAALAGTPMILTSVGKTSKVFNEKNALLFEVGNSKQLAAAANKILQNPKNAKKISANAKELIKKAGFDKKKILGENLKLYRQLIRA
ncbi:MAG: glycosyltransferase family 4 protein [Candidatus Diapherotrites archaeon]|nr:glycosyltransferase family 4 protein [Candidatus Diapherotrites archaeon]